MNDVFTFASNFQTYVVKTTNIKSKEKANNDLLQSLEHFSFAISLRKSKDTERNIIVECGSNSTVIIFFITVFHPSRDQEGNVYRILRVMGVKRGGNIC